MWHCDTREDRKPICNCWELYIPHQISSYSKRSYRWFMRYIHTQKKHKLSSPFLHKKKHKLSFLFFCLQPPKRNSSLPSVTVGNLIFSSAKHFSVFPIDYPQNLSFFYLSINKLYTYEFTSKCHNQPTPFSEWR